MAKIRVTRLYDVEIAQEDLDRVEQLNYSSGELIDACTRAADAGNLTGTMYLVRDDEAFPGTDDYSIGWVNDFNPEGQEILSANYTVQEVDVVID